MFREKESLLVRKANKPKYPVESSEKFPHLSDPDEDIMHSKIILADPNEVMSIIERERNELKCLLSSDGPDCPESMFTQTALDLLDEREMEVIKLLKRHNRHPSNGQQPPKPMVVQSSSLNVNAAEFVATAAATTAPLFTNSELNVEHSGNFIIDKDSSLTVHDIDIVATVNDSKYYFYQAADGQQLYMKSINVRMLQMMYGCLERAPQLVRGKILQKESCSMTEDLRKRLKYLQHLPVASQFEVVEIGLDLNFVSQEVLNKFKGNFFFFFQ